MRRVRESLAGKLILAVGVLSATGGILYWRSEIGRNEKNLMESAVAFVSASSGVVKRSLRHDMLVRQPDHLRGILLSISTSPSIEGVRIYSCEGTVRYSSRPEEEGGTVDRSSHACGACHREGHAPETDPLPDRQWAVYDDPSGRRLLSVVEPVYNEPDCSTAPCHNHPEDKVLLGVITTDFDLAPIDRAIRRQIVETSVFLIAFLSGSLCLLAIVLWRLVLQPLGRLSRGMVQVSQGDLSPMSVPSSRDEMGRLVETFNRMTGELHEARGRQEMWTHTLEEEVRKKTEQIRSSRDKLIQAEKLAALGRMTAEVAHEIRNPLATLGGFARRLRKSAPGEKEQRYAGIMVEEVLRLEKILSDVLSLSHMQVPDFKRLPLCGVVRTALDFWRAACTAKGIALQEKCDSEQAIMLDPKLVRQCLDNLIVNAVDAMPRGGTLTLDLISERRNHLAYVVLCVSDTGPGVPPEKLTHIFEPFFSTKVASQGTGLGLAICREIIERHGGHVLAENIEGGGFRISLAFPLMEDAGEAAPPCWQVMKCGCDVEGGKSCPAYPHFGRICWAVAGTYCAGIARGTFAQKYEDCRKCRFFSEATAEHREEGKIPPARKKGSV